MTTLAYFGRNFMLLIFTFLSFHEQRIDQTNTKKPDLRSLISVVADACIFWMIIKLSLRYICCISDFFVKCCNVIHCVNVLFADNNNNKKYLKQRNKMFFYKMNIGIIFTYKNDLNSVYNLTIHEKCFI